EDISARGGVSQNLSRLFVREMAAVIREGLLEDGVVQLSGLGIFRLKNIGERSGRDPVTGQAITIPAHRKVYFKPEKRLRELINTQYAHLKPLPLEPAPETKTEADAFNRFLNDSFVDGAIEAKVDTEETPLMSRAAGEPKSSPEKEIKYAPAIVHKGPLPVGTGEKKTSPPEEESHSRKGLYATIFVILLLIFVYMNYKPEDDGSRAEEQTVSTLAPQAGVETVVGNEKKQKAEDMPKTPPLSKPAPEAESVSKRSARSHLTRHGESLWRLARHYYDNGYLWPLLYEANHDKIENPDFLVRGLTLKIPALEGSFKKPTEADREMLALGHLRAYKAYRQRNHDEAVDHLRVAFRYAPELINSYADEIDSRDGLVLSNIP
ncbi:MAG TPA: hypothetical protein ENJ15_07980, partial [Caldithrix abyssi]|nr:hypothetical protein [Caldithrix abyssi]